MVDLNQLSTTETYYHVRQRPTVSHHPDRVAVLHNPENKPICSFHEVTAANAGLRMKSITDVGEAMRWLRQQPNEKRQEADRAAGGPLPLMRAPYAAISQNIRSHTLTITYTTFPTWLTEWMEAHEITLWGVADLRHFPTPVDKTGRGFPSALSWAIPMDPKIVADIQNGPNQAYADEYARVNNLINELSAALSAEIQDRGFRSHPLAASDRTDIDNIMGDFPHKTAATRAGLGWVGRHCQLITRPFGPWLRLGTVFSDIELPYGLPIERSFCGRCMRCVEACPAKALKGEAWYPGLPREDILDVRACDMWKKEHYYHYHKGHNCGICSAVCPYGLRALKRISDKA